MNTETTREVESTNNRPSRAPLRAQRYYSPAVDVLQGPDEVVLLAELPGATPEGIDVQFENNLLTLTANVAERSFGADLTLHHREYGIGGYRRTFEVSEKIDPSRITAEFSRGVLKLTLPLSERAQPKKIAVKTA